MRVGQGGTGPGAHTRDGSAVELYEVTPAHGEDEVIDAAIDPHSSILELGCGVGRITRPLLARGHHVVAVDESPEMLARVTGTETICSTIDELRLDRRFDVVLMMSFLINVADDAERLRLLRTCAHHVRPGGSVVLQQEIARHAPAVLEDEHRKLVIADVEDLPGGAQAATLTHIVNGRSWSQRIVTRYLSEDELTAQLAAAGLQLGGYLTPDRMWVRAHLS
ncbi:class I SAM-dependent methyltransferase [Kribbella jejuensis]|uniref:Methyltransferase family protein n=1 Tax=Kribbella jejuensis TaxID=236068 RepID=A0A542EKZ1_9ACTN|nr:class I SAM-dependent methyltransferase [Kribbella jejuensis]TQJ16007.1 methyltransferase family protein [Kribbella jejuensis]